MPVDSRSPARAANLDTWRRNRIAHEGERAVKASDLSGYDDRTARYEADDWRFLPPRPRMTGAEYRHYLALASWPGIVKRTTEGLTGSMLRDAPQSEGVPDAVAGDVTLTGRNVVQLAGDVSAELILTGEVTVVGDVTDGRGRPYLTIILAERILDIQFDRTADGRVVSLLRITDERWEPDPDDEWAGKMVPQVRVYRLVMGVYVVETYEKSKADGPDKGKWVIVDTRTFQTAGGTLDVLPIIHVTYRDDGQPPISPVVDMTVDLYRTRAAESLAIGTVLPTLVITGAGLSPAEVSDIVLGTQSVISFPAETAKAEFVGLGGDLASVQNRAESTLKLATAMGADIIKADKKAAETAEALRIRESSGRTLASDIADGVDSAMQKGLAWLARLEGRATSATFVLDRTTLQVDADRITRIGELFELGLLSVETALRLLVEQKALPDSINPEEEVQKIEASKPDPPAMLPPIDDDPPSIRPDRLIYALGRGWPTATGLAVGGRFSGSPARFFRGRPMTE